MLWAIQPRSPAVHRLAWAFVLLQGVFLGHVSLEVPWHEPDVAATRVDRQSDPVLIQEDATRDNLQSQIEPPKTSQISPPEPQGNLPASAPNSVHSIAIADQVSERPVRSTVSGSQVLFVFWLVGLVFVISLTFGSYLLFLLTMRDTSVAPPKWSSAWKTLLSQNGIERPIPLVLHETMGPMLCRLPSGYRVVVPIELWERFTRVQRNAVLQHELAHYLRGDIWKSLLARLLVLPHWFNPFGWWAVHRFDEASEWACDQRLADSNPCHVPEFARALLQLVPSPDGARVGVTAARGASLTVRIRRLMALQTMEDPVMKRCVLICVLVCLTAAGLFRIQLVAKESEETDASASSETFEQRVNRLALEIRVTDDELLRELQLQLKSRPGIIALKDRAAHMENMLREKTQSAAGVSYFEKHFVNDGNVFRLRKEHKGFRSEFLLACKNFDEDVARLQPVVREFASKITGDSDADRLAARFLNHDAAVAMLYVHELRGRLRPDITLIQQHLSELFVADAKQQYVLRAARRGEAQQFIKNTQRASAALKHLRAELQEWSKDFVGKDKFHQELKQAMADPRFAALIAIRIFEESPENAEQHLDGFFGELEEISRDTADGLVLTEEGRAHTAELLEQYRHIGGFAKKLKGSLTTFSDRIRSGDKLQESWKAFLRSDLGLIRLSLEIGPPADNPSAAITMLLHEMFDELDNGRFQLRGEDQEEAVEFIREMFRFIREIRRKGRRFDELAEKLDDRPLSQAYSSLAGKLTALRTIEQSASRQEFDGLSAWIDEHFEKTDDGFVLREEATAEIESVLEDIRNINKELKKNAF